MQSFWRNPQNIIALGVTLISVCALVVSITQTRVMIRQSELMDRQARASVRPIVELGVNRSFNTKTGVLTDFAFTLTNSGVGPATIDGVYVELDGNPVASWFDLIQQLVPPDTVPTYISNQQINHTVLQAGQSRILLDLSSNPLLAAIVADRADEIAFIILYRSLYDDRYRYTYRQGTTVNEEYDARRHAVVGEEFAG